MNSGDGYKEMWEDFAFRKKKVYLDAKFNPIHSNGFKNYLRERTLMSFLDMGKDDVFLDVGCASGRQVFLAALYCQRAVGIDIASGFVEVARSFAAGRGIKNVEFYAAPAESLPFNDHTFSKVLCAETLEHVLEPRGVLREIRRVLRPGGLLTITVPNKNGQATLWGRTKRFLSRRRFEPMREFSLSEIERHGDAHLREYDVKIIGASLEGEGYTIQRIRGASFIDFPFADKVINRLNRVPFIRAFLTGLEETLGSFERMTRWGRHLVVASRAKKC